MTNGSFRALALFFCLALLWPTLAQAEPAANSPPAAVEPPPTAVPSQPSAGPRLGAYAEVDLGVLVFLRQGSALAGGAKYGPFRAGLSYASFLSNPSLGGVPEGFDLRVNYLLGLNAAYFIAQKTDRGFYVQMMFHIKQQGVTNQDDGAHVNLNSLALGLELGYVWKIYDGLYVAPRVGALYYLNKPQPGNEPVAVGDKLYDNDRHKNWDTYYIPTLSVGYSWGK